MKDIIKLIIGGVLIVAGIVVLCVLCTIWDHYLIAMLIGLVIIIAGGAIGGYGLSGRVNRVKDNDAPKEIEITDKKGKTHTYTKKDD